MPTKNESAVNVSLRAPEPRDVNLIYIWENSSDEMHSSLRTGPVSRHQIQQFIENYDGEIYSQDALRYMIECNGETIGTIDIFDFDKRGRHAFVGLYIAPAARRQHIAATALAEVERLMKRNVNMHSLAALVSADNAPSQGLFASAGYKTAGRLQGWLADGPNRIDALIYQKVL